MTTSATQHLTPDQFTDCLISGVPPVECLNHLAQCQQCTEELAVFQSSVGNFNTASLAWSESRPSGSLRAAARSSRQHNILAPLAWALATAVLAFAALPILHHQPAAAPGQHQVQAVAPVDDTEAEIAQDNHLLQSVDVALAQVEPSPLSEYNLTYADSPRPKFHEASRIR